MAQRTNTEHIGIDSQPISIGPGAHETLRRLLRRRKSASQVLLRALPKALLGGIALLMTACPHAAAQGRAAGSFARLSQQADQARDAEDLDRAVRLYRQALALQPQWAEGWWSLGTIYYDRNAYTKAVSAFQRLIALNPKNGTAHAMLGLCQFELGQDDLALRNIQAGRRLGIQRGCARENRRAGSWNVGAFSSSVEAATRGLARSRDCSPRGPGRDACGH
jgi:tetratricopeptide (TPR) repeat protein